MKLKISVLLGGVLALCSLQAFAIDDCSADKFFSNAISIPFNKPTTVALGGLFSYKCFTVEVPTGVSSVKFESSSTNVAMAVKAGGYPEIDRVNKRKHDGYNDCAIPLSTNDCSVDSAESGLYRGVLQPSIGALNQNITFTVSADKSLTTSEPTLCSNPFDKSSYTNEIKVSSGEQPIGKIGGKSFACFKFAAPKHTFDIKVYPKLAEGVSTLYVGKLGSLPSTYDEDKNACTLKVEANSSCSIDPTGKSGDDDFYYMVYQNNGKKLKEGGKIAVEITGETNFSQ